MERVVVVNPFAGICGMIACACKDANDEEILRVVNQDNPCGTRRGWLVVVRDAAEQNAPESHGPLPCADDPERVHYVIYC